MPGVLNVYIQALQGRRGPLRASDAQPKPTAVGQRATGGRKQSKSALKKATSLDELMEGPLEGFDKEGVSHWVGSSRLRVGVSFVKWR